MWFYIGFMALPMLQFVIFYIGVNVNSVLLAFKDITFTNGAYSFGWTFSNFTKWFMDVNEFALLKQTLLVSVKSYFIACRSDCFSRITYSKNYPARCFSDLCCFCLR